MRSDGAQIISVDAPEARSHGAVWNGHRVFQFDVVASYGNPCFLFSARVSDLQAESRHNAADGVEQRDLHALIVGRS